jgi:hypothetical protein
MDFRRNCGPDSLDRLGISLLHCHSDETSAPTQESMKLMPRGVETAFGSDVISNDVTEHPRHALLSSAVLDYAAALA